MKLALLALLVIGTVYGEHSSTLLSSDVNVSEGCRAAVQRLSTLQATEPQLMAHYWDSWGKPSDGILTGHTTFLGYYDECMNLKNTDLGDMKYCIYPMIMVTNVMQRPSESEDGVCHSSNCPMPVNTSTELNVKVGVCYPSVCSANEFAVVLSKMNIKSMTTMMSDPFSDKTNTITINLNITEDSPPFCPVTDVEYDAGTIAVIAMCVILVGLVTVGTTVDIMLWILPSNVMVTSEADSKLANSISGENNLKDTGKENMSVPTKKAMNANSLIINIKHYILAFSLYNTVPNLLREQPTSALKALGGIRVISTFIVIINHVYRCISLFYPATSQNFYMKHLPTRLIFQPILNASFATEIFFVVSGTLSTYVILKDMEKHKRFRLKYFYLKRFLGLSPLLYFYTLVSYKLSAQFGQGPVWQNYISNGCVNTWWYNLLYLTNTIPHLKDMCITQAWHISADMQLFIFSPIFISLLYHVQYVGLAAVAITMIAATATVGYVSAANGYWAAQYYDPQLLQQVIRLHVKPFYRINMYFTGILLGYILYKKYNIATLPIANYSKRLIYALLWIIAIALCFVRIFGTYRVYNFTYHFSDLENVIFLMFSGLALSIGIAIIIYICNTGYGGVVNSFLSWPGWEPLVKLSYGVALCHILVLCYILGTLQSSLKYTGTVYAMLAVFTIISSYAVSAITAVFVEQPIFNVLSLWFKSAGKEAHFKKQA